MSEWSLAGGRWPGIAIHAWSLEEADPVLSERLGWLNADEVARADAFTRDEPRRHFILARGGLRRLLAERLGISPVEVAFAYGPSGKPCLAGDDPPHFNLAHTGELAVVAIADRPVGIDAEVIRPRKSASDLAARWFHPDEQRRIDSAGDPLAEFYRTWVMKEAALKLVGVGVGESLPKLLTPDDPAGGVATGLPPNELGIAACCVEPLAIGPNYAAALAFTEETR
ncbi:4'-phosphopantetheinyl transferase psf-1 [Planctomycetes bacterium MalM25]|nr:4'-phosphopantetheinyl transferase psf-1 [Planctomycetes bacterium MalM25]